MALVWPLQYRGRPLHTRIFDAMTSGQTRVGVLCAARRSGKSALAMTIGFWEALRGGKVWLLAPTWSMAREIFFQELVRLVPPTIVQRTHISDMRMDFPSGGQIWCKSADHPDALLGRGLTFVAADEFQSMPANLYETHLRPLVAETPGKPQGRVLLTGTPRGKGHPFFALWQKGLGEFKNQAWASWVLTAYEAGMVPKAEVEEMRLAALARGKTAYKLWQREWMADWGSFAGQVFEAWDPLVHIEEDRPKPFHKDDNPGGYDRAVLGMDFGFGEGHAGALTAWAHVPVDDSWHCVEECITEGKTVDSYWIPRIAAMAERWGMPDRDKERPALYCDPARPDHIALIRRESNGRWRTREADNDVWSGIVELATLLETQRLKVHRSCEQLQLEVPAYQWEQTPEGLFREKPKKAFDNAIDSARYALLSEVVRVPLGLKR